MAPQAERAFAASQSAFAKHRWAFNDAAAPPVEARQAGRELDRLQPKPAAADGAAGAVDRLQAGFGPAMQQAQQAQAPQQHRAQAQVQQRVQTAALQF